MQPWRGEIGYYPAIPGRMLRDPHQIEGHHTGLESWVVLVAGSGTLSLEGKQHAVKAPSWISAPDGRWSLRSDRESGDELAAVEFSLPNFDLGLFVRATLERYGPASVQEWMVEDE